MTDMPAPDAAGTPVVTPDPPQSPQERRTQLRASGVLVGVLAVIGALLGFVWEAWSPDGPAGAVLTAGIQPDETEAWVSGDAKYTVIVLVLGAVAAVVAWYLPALRRVRGPYLAGALALGTLAASGLIDLVGWAVRGDGANYHCGVGTCIDHLPLTVHMHGLWFAGPFLAILIYGLFVAFAVADDLGRPDHRTGTAEYAQPAPDGARIDAGDQQSTVL